jgi:hypothetical protein
MVKHSLVMVLLMQVVAAEAETVHQEVPEAEVLVAQNLLNQVQQTEAAEAAVKDNGMALDKVVQDVSL